MVAICEPHTETDLMRRYNDGPGWPNASREKEQAYRRGFLEEAHRVVCRWPGHNDEIHLHEAEQKAAHHLRLRVRRRYTVYGGAYGPGCAGRRTYILGYRPGHEVPAARLRGRHHALAFVLQSWDETADSLMYEKIVLPAWLTAVEEWTQEPIRLNTVIPPPRPIDIERPAPCLSEAEKTASPDTTRGEAPSPGRRLTLTRADQIEMRPPDWLLRGMLERDTFALIFGDPACGKSFLAIDWACRIAAGTPWRGHRVQGGPVVYVAGEGRQGFGRRVRAWQEHNGVSVAGAPLYVAPAVAIPEFAELAGLVAAIKELPGPPVLIVLDTLARCFGGGDENATKDMSAFVAACDALRRHYRCAMLVIHHAGHGDKSRARGAIALKAALDAEYRVVKTEGSRLVLTATKMKDAEIPPPLAMELVTADLPGMVDEYDNPVTSAAIEVLDAETSAIVAKAMATRPGKRGKWQEVGMSIAQRLTAASDDDRVSVRDWHTECESAGMRQSTRYDVLSKLHGQGALVVDGNYIVTP